VVERNTMVDVAMAVRWTCTFVCGVLGNGNEISMGFTDGEAGSRREAIVAGASVSILAGLVFGGERPKGEESSPQVHSERAILRRLRYSY
jgi:hypothetical protein